MSNLINYKIKNLKIKNNLLLYYSLKINYFNVEY